MNFKKYNEMELAMLASIANLTTEDVEDIAVEKGDIASVAMEECFVPSYLPKPYAKSHAARRKATFKKKVEQKKLAYDLGYNLSTEDSKVKNLLSANHMDRTYLRGEKADKKYLTVQEEKGIMEWEAVEEARDAMKKEHDGILGAIACDIDTLTLDLKSIEYSIENLEEEVKELEEAMKVASEKLKNAKLRKNGIQAALVQNKSDFATLSANFEKERISRFGW